jgi:hypothetical protein
VREIFVIGCGSIIKIEFKDTTDIGRYITFEVLTSKSTIGWALKRGAFPHRVVGELLNAVQAAEARVSEAQNDRPRRFAPKIEYK